jgi:DNA-binding NtrC family response regulator
MPQEFTSHTDLSVVVPPPMSQSRPANEVVPLLVGTPLSEIERELIVQTLARCNGNRTHAAKLLGMPVRTLRNKIRLYLADGIEVPAYGA